MLKILIADDHPVVRRGVRQVLSEEPDMGTFGEAQNSQEVLQLVKQNDWDVVVLDITMPGRGGIDILRELKRERPKLPVLILSVHPEDQYAVRALKAGAAGYITKESVTNELVEAIRKVLKGGRYVSASLAERLALRLGEDISRPVHEALSNREYQVMILIASGKRLGEIAEGLSLSVKTISTYRQRILEKMKMRNNSELIRYAIKHGFVS